MQRVAKHFNLLLPTPTIHRKVDTTDASETVPAEMLENIQDHMAHSKRTSDKFYQLQTTKKAIKAQKAIKTIIDARYFTSTQQIFHEWSLDQKSTPSLFLCGLIANNYHIMKTPQQLQDQWKTLLRKSKL